MVVCGGGWWLIGREYKETMAKSQPTVSPRLPTPPTANGSSVQDSPPAPRHEPLRRRSSAPSISQTGRNNIAQVGNNNQATINPEPPERGWVITNEICARLLNPVRTSGNPIDVSIGAFISDPDGANVVSQLMRCIPNVPGWRVTAAVLPPVPEGVTVTTSAETEPIAASLRNGLQAVGFNAEVRIIPNATDIEVWIGRNALRSP